MIFLPYPKQGYGLKPVSYCFFPTEQKLGVIHVILVTLKVRISTMTHNRKPYYSHTFLFNPDLSIFDLIQNNAAMISVIFRSNKSNK